MNHDESQSSYLLDDSSRRTIFATVENRITYLWSRIYCRVEDFDLEGMDLSWNSSQWVDVNKSEQLSDSDNSDTLPQLDGPADHRPGMFCLSIHV